MTFPAALEHATVIRKLPEHLWTGHRIADLATAYGYGYANLLWQKRHAAFIAFRANMEEGVAHGHGSKAAKREADLLTHKMAVGLTFSQSTRRLRLQRAADLAAEQTPEGREMAHHYRANIHE